MTANRLFVFLSLSALWMPAQAMEFSSNSQKNEDYSVSSEWKEDSAELNDDLMRKNEEAFAQIPFLQRLLDFKKTFDEAFEKNKHHGVVQSVLSKRMPGCLRLYIHPIAPKESCFYSQSTPETMNKIEKITKTRIEQLYTDLFHLCVIVLENPNAVLEMDKNILRETVNYLSERTDVLFCLIGSGLNKESLLKNINGICDRFSLEYYYDQNDKIEKTIFTKLNEILNP